MSQIVSFEESVPEELKTWSKIEALVCAATPESLSEAVKIALSDKNVSKESLLMLIINVGNSKPFSFHALGDAFETVWKSSDFSGKTFSFTDFLMYLVKRNIIDKSVIEEDLNPDKSVEEYENYFPKETLAFAVQSKDMKVIKELASKPDEKNKKYKFIFNDLYEGITALDLAAFVGATDVFNYLIEQGFEVTKDTAACAVRGGNIEIVKIVEEKGIEVSDRYVDAVSFHENEVAEYLMNKYNCKDADPITVLESWNTPVFCNLVKKGLDLNKGTFLIHSFFNN